MNEHALQVLAHVACLPFQSCAHYILSIDYFTQAEYSGGNSELEI